MGTAQQRRIAQPAQAARRCLSLLALVFAQFLCPLEVYIRDDRDRYAPPSFGTTNAFCSSLSTLWNAAASGRSLSTWRCREATSEDGGSMADGCVVERRVGAVIIVVGV